MKETEKKNIQDFSSEEKENDFNLILSSLTETKTNENLSGDIARELDFYRIRKEISLLAKSEDGQNEVLKREAGTDCIRIEMLKNEGREWNIYLHSRWEDCISNFPPLKEILPLLGVSGACLNQIQIFALGLFSLAQEKTKELLKSAKEELDIPLLSRLALSMPSLTEAKEEIFSVLDLNGEVRDLPSLREIRKKIVLLKNEIASAIRKYTSDSSLSSVLQSNVPALKNDRELLAVKSDQRGKIKGIIHEVSSSGNTVYIEVEEAVRANNDLVQEEAKLQSELRKIFTELTEKLSVYKEDFSFSRKIMCELDASCAAARYLSKCNGVFAEKADDEESPRLVLARHPLLKEKAVPINLSIPESKRVVIITGPNTGGKTVTLKTLALFALLNQAGFPIPAGEGSRLPVFSSIFADIGDEQSIDQNLSTFSSHMKKTGTALEKSDSKSLVLLDELGSGTDPLEGSAIAMAVLDVLIEKKSFVLVTTHHGVLKNYGYTNSLCINASAEFDNSTLKPTYRMLMGVPGESHALDIALRSGLSERIIEKARNYISTEQADVSALIKGLTEKHLEADELVKREKSLLEKTQEKEILLEEKELRLRERELEIKEKEKHSESSFIRETRSRLENLVRELREGEINREKTKGVKSFLSEISEEEEKKKKELEDEEKKLDEDKIKAKEKAESFSENGMKLSFSKSHASSSSKKTKKKLSNKEALELASKPKVQISRTEEKSKKKIKEKPLTSSEIKDALFAPGREVLAGKSRRRGILLRKEKEGIWSVQFGSITMKVKENQLAPAEKKDILQSSSLYILEPSSPYADKNSPAFELKLLGMRYEEAMKALERQMDLCMLTNFTSFSIVHGKGNGILQEAVHKFLKENPSVKEFHFAPPEEGGSGKTYVTLY